MNRASGAMRPRAKEKRVTTLMGATLAREVANQVTRLDRPLFFCPLPLGLFGPKDRGQLRTG